MRKIILKLFALSYVTKVFNTEVSFLRASNIIYPLFTLSGILTYYEVPFYYLSYIPLVVSLFFGFIYFNMYPIKDSEYDILDCTQKSLYMRYSKGISVIPECRDSVILFWINPIITIIIILLMLCS